MVVYSAADIRAWDAYTIQHEPIASIDLMERAAGVLCQWFLSQFGTNRPVAIFCGRGNNGGDGLALARMLHQHGCRVSAYALLGSNATHDWETNLQRLTALVGDVPVWDPSQGMPPVDHQAIVVDALLGTGLNRAPEGAYAQAIDGLNSLPNTTIAVDLPSGLFADAASTHDTVVNATHTCTFQCPKPAMFMPESEASLGAWHVLDIGLHPAFPAQHQAVYHYAEDPLEYITWRRLPRHAHKGMRGHALLGMGSATMMGAAVLATQAALRSGAGLVTVATDAAGWPVLQTAAPEAMCGARGALTNESFQSQKRIDAIGVGCGWLADEEHMQQLAWLLAQSDLPLLVDATALGLLAQMPQALAAALRPERLVLTPHVGEFDRLFGHSANHFERLEKARTLARQYQCTLVLKGAFTRTITPEGKVYFNSTGNPGMAKGGSGDVLSGLITGLMARGLAAPEAALLGVWLHGHAGDLAAQADTPDGMTAGSIIRCLPRAWAALEGLVIPGDDRRASSLPAS